jgi:hypothetical protein
MVLTYCLLLNDKGFLHIITLNDLSSKTNLYCLCYSAVPLPVSAPLTKTTFAQSILTKTSIANDVFSGSEQISKATTLPRGLELSDLFVI